MDNTSKRVLLISGGGNTAPLWKGLSELVTLVFLHPNAEQAARGAGITNILSMQEMFTPEVQEKAVNQAAIMTARVVAALPGVSEKIHSLYPAPPENLNGNLQNWFAGFVAERTRNQVFTLTGLEKLSQEREIIGCLTHEDVTPDMRGMVNFCNSIGAQTIHLPHAACHLLPGVEDIHRQVRARWILSSGPYMTEFYMACGVPQHRIVPVGIPEWDGLADAHLPTKEEARSVLQVGLNSRFVVLYGTTWGQTTSLRSRFEHEFVETHEAVFSLCREKDADLIINMHPNEAPQMEAAYIDMMKKAGIGGAVTRAHEIYIVRAADVVIKHGPSNFCIKVAMMGRPSAYIQTEGFDFDHPLPPRGPASQLPALVDAALNAPIDDWDKYIRHYDCAWPHENATEKTINAVREICNI